MLSLARKGLTFASKGFEQNLVYLGSHLINTVASALFGVLYIFMWRAVVPPSGFLDYTQQAIVHYVIFNQTTCWLTQFGMRIHSKIAESIRSGSIATEMSRPVDYFFYRITSEIGSQMYSLLWRGLPCGLMLLPYGFYLPRALSTYVYTLLALALGGYISIVISYLVGVTAFWTTEIRTAGWISITLKYGFGGVSMPIEVLPQVLYHVARFSPFACLNFYPARIYLGLSGPELLLYGAFWSVAITLIAQAMTRVARRKLEVQGG